MSQNTRIKEWQNDGNTLTPLQALEKFGCFRLASRIHDLRQDGLDVQTNFIKHENGNRFAIYELTK